jgi:hypothetical protein
MHDWYIFGAWLMHSLMVQVEVQVGAWLMHLFMVHGMFGQVICTGAWLMHYGTGLGTCLVHVVTGCLVQVDWYRFTTVYLTVIV